MIGVFFLLTVSCYREAAEFPFTGTESVLYARSREAAAGTLARPGKLAYVPDPVPVFPPASSLELEYRLSRELPASRLVLTLDAQSWILPLDLAFLGDSEAFRDAGGGILIRYAVPFSGELHKLELVLEGENFSGGEALALRSLGIVTRWFGFSPPADSRSPVMVTPFVYAGDSGDPVLVIDPPETYRPERTEILIEAELPLILEAAEHIRYSCESAAGEACRLTIPRGALPSNPYPLSAAGDWRDASLRALPSSSIPFPDPIPADPGLIMDYPQGAWRDERYEVFRWDRFPLVLIFDTADYRVQDRLFKRLAFFVEKAGYRGTLVPDAELAELHGWNAHDYRAEDLVRFFETAERMRFPLLPEERELRELLLQAGILRRSGSTAGASLEAGAGAIISISRESSGYLRNLFMVHEGFHGIFFIDGDFQDFSRRRWDNLAAPAKRFILSYLDFSRYDTEDSYLMVNEFMAYCLQQSASLAGEYFGKTLASRLETSWRASALPLKDAVSGTWPELDRLFSAEAEAFSGYVKRRWGLEAGRIRRITTRYLR
jgi:hypothetical protein